MEAVMISILSRVTLGKYLWSGILMVAMLCPSAVPVHAEVSDHTMSEFTSAPISLIESAVSPQVIINSSKDHQLFFKAYNDYADLDNDDQPETTYKHSIDYYGYFDSNKCYDYDTVDKRFEPAAFTADKYCTGANDGYWSGNFLNWASMTRIDAIRKILFGGHRRVDTSTSTVLERAYIPPDIHAFAKFYDGSDVNDLIPFAVNTSEPTGTSTPSGTSISNITIGTGSKSFNTNQAGSWINVGDTVRVFSTVNPANYMQGAVTAFDSSDGNPLTVNVTQTGGAGTFASWSIIKMINIGTGSKTFATQMGSWIKVGDYVSIVDHANSANFMQGWVTAFDSSDGKPLTVNVTKTGGAGTLADWDITNHTRTGITLCNVTYSSTAGVFSQNVTDPPLIRTAQGNYTFWSAGEVTQCLWDEEESSSGDGVNYNNPYYSDIYAAQDNPTRADVGLGLNDYVVRVQVCIPDIDSNSDGVPDKVSGTEKCKQYPYGNFKPTGLLQVYGDDDKLLFGMVAGTYGKSRRGGEIA